MVLLTVEYDGTEFHGWQEQRDQRTVQGELRAAVRRAFGHDAAVRGASRTDAGVHACGQAACFATDSPVPTGRVPRVLDAALPPDIRVRDAREVGPEFDPRREAAGKIYRYTWYVGSRESVFLRRFASRLRVLPDVAAMDRAARHLPGRRDLAAFRKVSEPAPATTVRDVFAASVEARGALLTFRVAGSGFLYRSVRILAGTLLEAGCGRRDPDSIPELFDAGERARSGPTAEARGLCLLGVYYDREALHRAWRADRFEGPFPEPPGRSGDADSRGGAFDLPRGS